MKKIIAAIFINDSNGVLLLKRTKERKSYPNKWNVISAIIEEGEFPRECLDREIKEELGDIKYELVKKAEPYKDIQKEGKWFVHPFLCKIIKGKIELDKREHDAYEWVLISDLDNYDLVPGVKSDLKVLGLV